MKPTLRKDILTETYKDMQKLVAGAAWNFWYIYGGDVDDLIAQANLIFIDAFDTYDSSRSKLTTWLTFKIRKGLFEYMRNGNGHRLMHARIDDEFIKKQPAPNGDFSVIELVDEMEQDARIVLQLFLETPREVMVNILNSNRRIDHAQAHMRKRLRNRLRQMGWTVRRIRKAFEEIKNATSY